MALPTASDNKFPKLILEEVADDGSATVTPASDHRALFLGEDGTLRLKDSSAAVTDVGGGGGGGSGQGLLGLKRFRKVTGNNYSLTATSWTAIDTSLDMTVAASTGDVLEFHLESAWNNDSNDGFVDVATMVSGSAVNWFGDHAGASTGFGVLTWWAGGGGATRVIAGTPHIVVQAGDISGGNVLCRIFYRVSAGTKLFNANTATLPIFLSLKNLGPVI